MKTQRMTLGIGLIAIAVQGCSPANQSEAQNIKDDATRVAAFKKIVDEISSRAVKPVKYLQQIPRGRAGGIPAGGKWIRREIEYSIHEFDIRKTDSLITPYVAHIQLSKREAAYIDPKGDNTSDSTDIWFDSEQDAMQAKEVEYRFAKDFEMQGRLRNEYRWQNDQWVPEYKNAAYPFSDNLHEVNGFDHMGNGVYTHEVLGTKKTYE